MPYSSMTLQALAQMLGMDIRRLERMAQRGEIPCQKIGGQFRFNSVEITEWLQQTMGAMNEEHLAAVDAGITAHRQAQQDASLIIPLLRIEAVNPALTSRSKNGTLRQLVGLAQETGLVYDGEALLEAVILREDLCSTAMEGGIAIPHPRRPLPYDIADTILVIGRADQGILFGGPDGPTRLFFMTASLDDTQHLHVLARLCRMLRDPDLIPGLLEAQTAQEMVDLTAQAETRVLERGV